MTTHANVRTSVSALMGAAVLDRHGQTLGHVREFAVEPAVDATHVLGMIIRLRGAASVSKASIKKASIKNRGTSKTHGSLVPIRSIRLNDVGAMQLRDDAMPVELAEDERFLLLERDLLDQQIIDIHGHKVVRVNDVDLVWEFSTESGPDLSLRIAQVEVGTRGAVRRLLKGLPVRTVESIACRIGSRVIPWDFVDLIDRDPARRVKLKIEQERLSRMHPSDLAEILQELAPAERQALFRSLDEEVAAEALEEVDPKLQRALIEDLDSESVAGIVEEMDPGAAADLLSELTEERSDAILEEMDPEERQEVEELLEFAGDSAAGQMTTDYVALDRQATVGDAIRALGEYEGDLETITDIYLLNHAGSTTGPDDALAGAENSAAEGTLFGLVPLVRLLLSPQEAALSSLPPGHLVCCKVGDSAKKVAELFDKYNLRSLAVVDEDNHLAGVILAEHVIAVLRAR